MKTVLARYTEWAWLEGRVSRTEELQALARDFLLWLHEQFAGSCGSQASALEEIERDMSHTLRVLSYGGRCSQEIAPPRREFLEREAEARGWDSAA